MADQDTFAWPRHDRIVRFSALHGYPERDVHDSTFWLPESQDRRRRLWVYAASESPPVIRVDDAVFTSVESVSRKRAWIDYGVAEVPQGFTQLRVEGLSIDAVRKGGLVISSRLDFALTDESVEQVERRLWGLARLEAGETTLKPSRHRVGEPIEMRVRYAAGPGGLPAGSVVRFAVPILFDRPQCDDPAAPGYLRISSADVAVQVVAVERSIESHTTVDVFCRLVEDMPPDAAFELTYRSRRTYIFPYHFHVCDRATWYAKLPPLAAAVARGAGVTFVPVDETLSHAMTFVAGPPERLHLFLPGRRSESTGLTLRGIFTDRLRNLPPAGTADIDFRLFLVGNGESRSLGTPARHFTGTSTFQVPLPPLAPGVYRVEARRRQDGELVTRSNPLQIVSGDEMPSVYWGEIHAHTEMSDGSGPFPDLYRQAREVGCLDFAAAADHACYFSDNQWEWMQDVTNAWNREGTFVTLNGYEWAGRQVHRNIYTSRDRLALFRGMYEPQSNLDTVWGHFSGDEAIVGGPHGSLAHGLRWEHHDPSVERFVEVYSMWGASDRRDNPLVPDMARNNPGGISVIELLESGVKLGFTGGGDCHEGRAGFSSEDPRGQGQTSHTFARRLLYRCGLTAAVMPELTRSVLIQALRERRTYATTGARILLDFSVSSVLMGQYGRVPADPACRVTVHAHDFLERIEIVRDGCCVLKRECTELDVELVWHDRRARSGREHWYYLHVFQQDGHQAWSSPVWVTVGP